MGKIGRPKSNNPKVIGYRIRLTEDEHKQLIAMKHHSGKFISQMIREALQLYFQNSIEKDSKMYDENITTDCQSICEWLYARDCVNVSFEKTLEDSCYDGLHDKWITFETLTIIMSINNINTTSDDCICNHYVFSKKVSLNDRILNDKELMQILEEMYQYAMNKFNKDNCSITIPHSNMPWSDIPNDPEVINKEWH